MEARIIDSKCMCGHWGHEHPLYNSDNKRQCRMKCECDDYRINLKGRYNY